MIGFLERMNRFLTKLLLLIGGITLMGMIFLTCSNIFLRVVWVPIRGTFELMGFFGAIVTAFTLGYTQMRRGHIAVDVLVNHYSKKTRKIINSINYFICMMFFSIATWQIAKWATTLWKTGEITETLRIIHFPFIYGVACGCAVLSLVLLTDLLNSLIRDKEVDT